MGNAGEERVTRRRAPGPYYTNVDGGTNTPPYQGESETAGRRGV